MFDDMDILKEVSPEQMEMIVGFFKQGVSDKYVKLCKDHNTSAGVILLEAGNDEVVFTFLPIEHIKSGSRENSTSRGMLDFCFNDPVKDLDFMARQGLKAFKLAQKKKYDEIIRSIVETGKKLNDFVIDETKLGTCIVMLFEDSPENEGTYIANPCRFTFENGVIGSKVEDIEGLSAFF